MSTSPEQTSFTEKEGIQIIRGFPMSNVFKKEFVEETFDHQPREGDVIIASYPKTGTTWMKYIVIQILTKGESFPSLKQMREKFIPYLEKTGAAAVDAITTLPRLYKIHMPYDRVKKHPKAKFIYVYRRPEDTFVSYYYFMKHFHEKITFDEYLEDFLTGNISYGRYFEHVLSYLKREQDGNILLVSYENLHRNRREEILRISKFLGEKYYNDLRNDQSALEKIIKHTTFDYMKQNLKYIEVQKENKEVPFRKIDVFRKGVVGDGKKSLTADQLKRMEDLAKEVMKGTNVLSDWLNN